MGNDLEVGDKIIMLFSFGGQITEETYMVIRMEEQDNKFGPNRTIVTLDTGSEWGKCFDFDLKTGNCLNDNTWGGAKRSLKK